MYPRPYETRVADLTFGISTWRAWLPVGRTTPGHVVVSDSSHGAIRAVGPLNSVGVGTQLLLLHAKAVPAQSGQPWGPLGCR